MNRLIKAEWYRVRHSNNIIKWLILISVVLAVMPLSDLRLKTSSDYMMQITTGIEIFITFFLIIFSSVILGFIYLNKTGLYEVMAGNNINHIIMSKVTVDVTFISIVVSLSYGVLYIIMGLIRGWGNMDKTAIRFLLFFVILYHISLCGILIMMSFRQMAGAVFAFLKFELLDTGIMFLLEVVFKDEISNSFYEKLMNWFITNQITGVIARKITISFVTEIILSLVVEFVFWYAIAYYGMKKKKY